MDGAGRGGKGRTGEGIGREGRKGTEERTKKTERVRSKSVGAYLDDHRHLPWLKRVYREKHAFG